MANHHLSTETEGKRTYPSTQLFPPCCPYKTCNTPVTPLGRAEVRRMVRLRVFLESGIPSATSCAFKEAGELGMLREDASQ